MRSAVSKSWRLHSNSIQIIITRGQKSVSQSAFLNTRILIGLVLPTKEELASQRKIDDDLDAVARLIRDKAL